MDSFFREKISLAISRFNAIRVPEAKAELVKVKNNCFLIKFSGPMCATCGTFDYFEDLLFELKDLSMKAKILSFQNLGDHYLVEYQILE